tara:strand:- start:437 stop:1711 length:1275 start_codon:yes stop_codon:yes gene_type:complete
MTTRNFRVNTGLSVGAGAWTASTDAITGVDAVVLSTTTAPTADGELANKKFVDDSITAISTTAISQLNTNVTVADSGSGTITATVDGTTEMIIAAGTITGVGKITLDNTTAPDADGVLTNKKYVDDQLSGLSQNSISQLNTSITVTDSGTNGKIVVLADAVAALTMDSTTTRVHGNLVVDGTQTIVNTTTMSIEDNIIEVNRNISANSGMPSYSGLKVNRGGVSTATEEDLWWVWDEAFADDGTTIYGNAGGAWTAIRASGGPDNKVLTPTTTETNLVDIRCNVVHATSTSAQYSDVAERFEADAPMAEGAVVEIGGDDEITEATTDLSDNVFGVISSKPAYAMNAGAGNNDSHPFVAMTGRTPVRVTGTVTKGQRLVSSSVKGTARAVATGETISPFHVIGRALENKADEDIGLVNCAVRTNN